MRERYIGLMSRFTILLGGELTATPRLLGQIAGSRVIAADSGMAHAEALGADVELWVGDFDSSSDELIARFNNVPRETHPSEKNATDGELAIARALERGARNFVLAGGLGGQTDHLIGHFGLALGLARRSIPAFLTSGDEEAWPLFPGRTLIDVPAGSRLSILPLTDLAGLDLTGVKWPLLGADVSLGSSLTLSNVALGSVEISLKRGHGVAIAYPA
jgi:thiamine pyrophosphokinase